MSDNGIAYIKFAGTDRRDWINYGKITWTLQDCTAIVKIERDLGDPISWTPYNAEVLINDDNDINLFHGWIFTHKEPKTTTKINYELVLYDPRLAYAQKYRQLVIRGTNDNPSTVKSALQSIITTLTDGDEIEINEAIDDPFEYDFSNPPATISDMILKTLMASTVKLIWRTRYDAATHKIYHQFIEGYLDNVGEIGSNSDLKLESTGFYNNYDELKNSVVVTAPNVEVPDFQEQFHIFERDNTTFEAPDGIDVPCVPIPLDYAPQNLQVFLMLGSWNNDYSKLTNCSKWRCQVKAIDPKDEPLLAFDIARHMRNTAYYLTPNGTVGTSTGVNERENVAIPNLELTEIVKQRITGWYDEDFTCYYNSRPINDNPATINGCVWCPDLSFLTEKINKLRSLIGFNFTTENIIGYMITFNFTMAYSQIFNNDQSIIDYGERASKQIINIDTNDLSVLSAFGRAKLEILSTLAKAGQCIFRHWYNGTQYVDFYPKPGDLVDIYDSLRGNVLDASVKTVSMEIFKKKIITTIDGSEIDDLGLLPAFVDTIESGLNRSLKNTKNGCNTVIRKTSTITFDADDVAITTIPEEDVYPWVGQNILNVFLK